MQDLGRFKKQEHIEIQTRYVSFLIAGSVALVGLVFALGVLVGSRQAKVVVPASKDPLATIDAKSNEPSAPDLQFYENLSVIDDKVPTPASLLVKGNHQIMPSEVSLSKPKYDEPAVLEDIRNDEPVVYSLQVGSFDNRHDASSLANRLERAGYKSWLVSVNMPERGGQWFRVRVGPFSSKREAWKQKDLFEEKEKITAFVVKRRIKE